MCIEVLSDRSDLLPHPITPTTTPPHPVEQRKVDNFWGIDLHLFKLQRETARRHHLFLTKTEEMRRMMVHVQLVQPYKEELQGRTGILAGAVTGDFRGLYRDFKTGKKLTYTS